MTDVPRHRPRPAYRRFAVWAAGVVLTGRLAHGLGEDDLRARPPAWYALNLASLAVVAGSAWYVVAVVPAAALRTLLLPGVLVGAALGVTPFAVQFAGALLARRL